MIPIELLHSNILLSAECNLNNSNDLAGTKAQRQNFRLLPNLAHKHTTNGFVTDDLDAIDGRSPEDRAATRIQAVARGHMSRKKHRSMTLSAGSLEDEGPGLDPETSNQDHAARRIQAVARGHMSRKKHRSMTLSAGSLEDEDPGLDPETLNQDHAARRIQAVARKHISRKKHRSEEHDHKKRKPGILRSIKIGLQVAEKRNVNLKKIPT